MKKRFCKTVSLILTVIVLISSISLSVSAEKKQENEDEVIKLYALSEEFQQYITIPEGYPTEYIIKVPDDGSEYEAYHLGDNVSADENLKVTPLASPVNVIGAVSGTFDTVMQYEFGTCKLLVTSNNSKYCKTYTFEVVDYSDIIVENAIKSFVKKNITEKMTTAEKLDAIGKYIASFDYNEKHQSLKGMLVNNEGGDCWASTDAAILICEYLGIPARACSDERVSLFTGGHTYAVAYDGETCYKIEAGYSGKAPRLYDVSVINPFIVEDTYDGTGSCIIVNYLGNSSEIKIPEKIDGKTVVGIANDCFSRANNYIEGGIKKITLPDTIKSLAASCFYDCNELLEINFPDSLEKIGMAAFINCKKLRINISEKHPHFTIDKQFIYTKDKKEIICAYNPDDDCVVPNGTEILGDCSFYNTDFNNIKLPSTLKDIKYKAFCYSDIEESIVVPASVEGIGYGAFCCSTSDITILNPDCVINNTKENNLCDQEDGNTVNVQNVYGYKGSTLEKYAETYELTFSEVCPEILKNGRHKFNAVTCLDEEKVCSACSITQTVYGEHDLYATAFSYYSNTNAPFAMYYCRNENCNYSTHSSLKLSEFTLGDADFDGKITAADARIVLRTSVNLEWMQTLWAYTCNVDNDEYLNASDARLILRASVGLEDPKSWTK